MSAPAFDLSRLRRYPDVEAPDLLAVDAADRLVLEQAATALAAAGSGEVAVIGDRYGALTLGAIALHGARDVRVHQDAVVQERALVANAERAGLAGTSRSLGLVPELVTGARVVLLQLPRGLAALEEIAELVAAHAAPDVVVVAGGRLKHMSRGMNEVLGKHFADVTASLARQKSRCLVARLPTPPGTFPSFPRRHFDDEHGLWIAAHGAAFAGPSLDLGTRYLLTFLGEMSPLARDAVDLGCGTGVLAAQLAAARPDLHVVATDTSSAAVRSARATVEANALDERVEVVRADGLESRPPVSADLIVCNPPFHVGASVQPDVAIALFKEAARVLRPGGELWAVFNSRLGHAGALRRIVGSTKVMGDNGRFTVTRSIKQPSRGERGAAR
ncbi:16S rRNA (guanine1207-N2)-methyltransferase [Georgenia satyanarayanai]|uniref:16S rRNA (Guanine1207-N2)-methyltransferase n=1 Tax=Georgenia satyanarayanai TaxID=860221 RepID=A0A2Y9A4I4_9MICO|nr:class I SAM-dependent methyltransferase [Georgenia satyanarayanai]PYG02265.1 16S rRNA (guanine1207-N2)-methyltransferase [Georgenia satyanarayanai]SSA37117.1 16S rRNA (guanine1207-N2)-methyltransferase [Georgenia satyanarayanai]